MSDNTADDESTDPQFDHFVKAVRAFKEGSLKVTDNQEEMNKLKEEIKKQLSSLTRSEGLGHAEAPHDAPHHPFDQIPTTTGDESDSEYEDNGDKGKVLIKESKRGPFVPHVSPAVRVDETPLSAIQNMSGDLTEQLAHLEDKNYFTPHALNYTMPQRDSSEYPFEHLEEFVPKTDPSRFREDEQGQRHCVGRKQRRGKKPDAELGCHLIDLDTLHPVNIPELKRFLTQDGEILHRRHTGLCPRCQRQVRCPLTRTHSLTHSLTPPPPFILSLATLPSH